MPRPYPAEFRARAVALVRSGKQAKQVAYELGISAGCLHNWIKQDRIDRGELTGKTTSESAELRAARKQIRELETELAIIRHAAKFLAEDRPFGNAPLPHADVVATVSGLNTDLQIRPRCPGR